MRTTWKPVSHKTKRDDLVESSRFFVSGEGNEKRKQKMRSRLFLFMVLGLVGLMCGCELGTTALSESDISDNYYEEVKKSLKKLILTGNCKECPFVGVDISGKDLSHRDLTEANLSGFDLTKANLKGADVKGAYFHRTKFGDQTDLTEADLTGTKNLKDARYIQRAKFCNTKTPWGVDNSGCKKK